MGYPDLGLYCYTYLPSRQEVGVYSLERFQAVTLTETGFQHDEAILHAIKVMRDRAFGILDDGDVLPVVLQFAPDQARYVAERVWHPMQQLTWQADGTLLHDA